MNAWAQEFPRRELAFQGQGPGFSLLLKRNCSISPSGLLRVYGLIAFVTIGIAAAFAALGAWLILPFAGIEIVCLGVAFVLHGRHAADYERIELAEDGLTVEVCVADEVRRDRLNPAVARVDVVGEAGAKKVMLGLPGRRLEVGRHLHEQARLDLAAELKRRLRN